MKLQNLSIIFIIIMIPILLIVSYYIQMQIDTITLQTTYDSKLIAATKDAIEAFEINTVEWNDKYSDVAGSKRRDLQASINTFMTSLGNGLGISGTNKEYIENYIPAILYTLYDGYYIYTPTETYETLKDENGVDRVNDEGKILYDNGTDSGTTSTAGLQSTTKHTLLPFAAYSEQNGTTTVNYTLDNYIKVYGNFIQAGNYGSGTGDCVEEGFLVYFDVDSHIEGARLKDSDLTKYLKYKGKQILPETLTENVEYRYKDGNKYVYKIEDFKYIYIEDSQGDKTKLYYYDNTNNDSIAYTKSGGTTNNWFTLNSKNERVFLTDDVTNVTQYVYKKVSLPGLSGYAGRYINFYQVLNGSGEKDNWYADLNQDDELTPSEKVTDLSIYNLNSIQNDEDCSAINYYVQSYFFTKWVHGNVRMNELKVSETNNPEDVNSDFYKHKTKMIKEKVNNSLAQAIRNYAGNTAQDYRLPVLTENEWDQILSNISMVTFMQQIPVGFKTYNNYAIATSTNNKEYVDPNEIYFVNDSDEYYYHRCYCQETKSIINLIGYRNIDFIEKNFKLEGSVNYSNETKGYFLHSNGTFNGTTFLNGAKSSMECYYCLVNRANYTETTDATIKEKYTIAYNEALARERYKSKQDVVLAKDFAELKVQKSASIHEIEGNITDGKAEVGDIITWEITITNTGFAEGTAYVDDSSGFPKGLEVNNINISKNSAGDSLTKDSIKGVKGSVTVPAATMNAGGNIVEGTNTITIETTVTPEVTLGTIRNIVVIKNTDTDTTSIDEAIAPAQIEQTIALNSNSDGEYYNIVMVVDYSNSMLGQILNLKEAILNFMKVLDDAESFQAEGEEGTSLSIIRFGNNAQLLGNWIGMGGDTNAYDKNSFNRLYNKIYGVATWPDPISGLGTFYKPALEKAREQMEILENRKGHNKNVVIFMSDGHPTTLDITTAYRYNKTTGRYQWKNLVGSLFILPIWWPVNDLSEWSNPWTHGTFGSPGILATAEGIRTEYDCDFYGVAFRTIEAADGLELFCNRGVDKAADADELKQSFEDIAGKLSPKINVLPNITSNNGTINLDVDLDNDTLNVSYADIKMIKVDDVEYTLEEAKENSWIEENGGQYYLILQKIAGKKVEIVL